MNAITLLPEPAHVKSADKDDICAAKTAYDALTDSEKAIVGSDYAEKLNAALETLANLDKGSSPQTGDQRHTFLWIALLFASSGVLTIFGVKSRKRRAVK